MSKYEELSKAELYRKERKERLAKEAKKNAKRNAKVAKMKRIAIRAVAVVAAVAIVLGATVAIVNYTGSLFFKPAIAKVGDTKISSSEFQYYYRTTYANLVSNAATNKQFTHFEINYLNECKLDDSILVSSIQFENKEFIIGKNGDKAAFTSLIY